MKKRHRDQLVVCSLLLKLLTLVNVNTPLTNLVDLFLHVLEKASQAPFLQKLATWAF